MTEDPDSQLIVATHSPILLAYPDARIWSFDGADVAPVSWDRVPAVQVMQSFVGAPDFWLRRLLDTP